MSKLPIISADERLKENRGIKGCIFGKSYLGYQAQLCGNLRSELIFSLQTVKFHSNVSVK